MLKVLFACRPQIFEVPGGDTVQLLKMQQYLRSCTGVEATISPDPSAARRDQFDLVHLPVEFAANSLRETVDEVADALFNAIGFGLVKRGDHCHEYLPGRLLPRQQCTCPGNDCQGSN